MEFCEDISKSLRHCMRPILDHNQATRKYLKVNIGNRDRRNSMMSVRH